MSFVKLDVGILDSSLWVESAEVRVVFVTMLAMARPDGLVEATAPGIARRANLPLQTVRRALETLASPDPESRTLRDDGRRIRRVDGGYVVINYAAYRAKDHTAAERKRRQRERVTGDVTLVTRDVTRPSASASRDLNRVREGERLREHLERGREGTPPRGLPSNEPRQEE
jgi:hypothetical protein